MLGTVEGDLHDVGKDLVGLILEGSRFRTIHLGVNVPARDFLDTANKHEAQITGLSAFLTTTLPAYEGGYQYSQRKQGEG